MKKLFVRGLLSAVILSVLFFGAVSVFKPQISDRLVQRAVDQRVGIDPSEALPDGLHVYLCGTGSPLPDENRAGPCLAVLAGDKAFVVDAGSGAIRKLGRMGFPMEKLQGVYLTHLHSDHIDGLGELLMQAWVGGQRDTPLPVYGPVGTARVVDGLREVYATDRDFRVVHHGADIVRPAGYGGSAVELEIPKGPAQATILNREADLTISGITVDHGVIEPALGYRFDYKGRSVSISGDTVFNPAFTGMSKDVDVMFHEALNPKFVGLIADRFAEAGNAPMAQIMVDIQNYHSTPEDAARTAREAGARELVLYHIVPSFPSGFLDDAFLGGAKAEFDGPVIIGEDGFLLSLPVQGDDISYKRVLK